jgi:hypothetical protein
MSEKKKFDLDDFMAAMDRISRDRDADTAAFNARHEKWMADSEADSERRKREDDERHRKWMAEADRRDREARVRHEEWMAEADRRDREARERYEEWMAESKESTRKLDKLNETVNGIGQNSGYHAEQFFQNALDKTKMFAGIKFDKMIPNLGVHGRENCEFDMALVNGDTIALLEAKNRIHPKYVRELATEKLTQFRKLFPEYRNYSVYLGVAGFSFDKSVVEEARKYGVGVVRQDGDSVQVDADGLKVY